MLPNVFLVGAPKCGTTSITHWLGQHPEVCTGSVKEPNFFSRDIESDGRVTSLRSYQALYKQANFNQRIVVDASTTYLRSQVAVDEILSMVASPKFIVCLRNPVEMVFSVHAQLAKSGRQLDDIEAVVQRVCDPQGDSDQKDGIDYFDVCALGRQVEALLSKVDGNQVLFVFLEDLRNSPRQELRRLLEFLSLPEVETIDLEVKNERMVPRSFRLARLARLMVRLKAFFGFHRSFGVLRSLNSLLLRKPIADERSPGTELTHQLQRVFKHEIEMLEQCTGKPLGHWKS